MPVPGENDSFVRFVQLALTDPDTSAFVRKLGEAAPEDRAKLLTATAARMRQEKVPEETIQVVELLREPALLDKILEIMTREGV